MIRLTIFDTDNPPPAFRRLPAQQQAAILAHEEGHRAGRHVWKRIWAAVRRVSREEECALYHAQEFEADAYARDHGHGAALAAYLAREPLRATHTHPSTAARVAKLLL